MKYRVYDVITDETVMIDGEEAEFDHLSDAEDASMKINVQLQDAIATDVQTVFEYGDE